MKVIREREIYKNVVSGIDEEILLISRDYKIVWANKYAIDRYGSDIINQHCYYATHGFKLPCQGPFGVCPLNEVLATGKSSSATHVHSSSHDGGLEHHVAISVYPIRDGNGKIIQFVHIAKDVTDRVAHRQAEEKMWQEIIQVIDKIYAELVDNQMKLEKSKEALEERTLELERSTLELQRTQDRLIKSEKLAAIGQLAASVAHELRNPLGVIKNSAYYLRGQLIQADVISKYPNISEFLNIIENEISLSDKIIRDLLNFSIVSPPIMKPSNINDIIDYAVSVIDKPENIKVKMDLKSDMAQVVVDPHQIQQAFNNLILNAYQSMVHGGTLRITSREKDNFVFVEFKDDGVGIREEDKNKIFDALFTTKAKGIGLGLAVTHAIVERHGGQIKFESEFGKGTTFRVKIPIIQVKNSG